MIVTRRIFLRLFGRIMTTAILIVAVVIGMYVILFRIFTIRSIEIAGGGVAVTIDETKLPKTLLFFPSEQLRAELLREYPQLSDIRFTKIYPQTLRIDTEVRKPTALLVTGGQEVVLDHEGLMLPPSSTRSELPVLFIDIGVYRTGQRIEDKRIVQSLLFLERVKDLVRVESVTESDGSSLQAKTSKTDIIFTQQGDITTIVTTLQKILEGFRIKGTLPRIIDLRFNKPIVTF